MKYRATDLEDVAAGYAELKQWETWGIRLFGRKMIESI